MTRDRFPRTAAEAFPDERVGWHSGPYRQPLRKRFTGVAIFAAVVIAALSACMAL
jgi:hypothetical protein